MTGNILKSDADCLINTVNCEGFMGKGLAYQFKNMFPKTNISYVDTCKHNELHPGKLHYHLENGKLIINFPTKDRWREKSKIEYIDDGMKALVKLVYEKNIKSIAIPPLGSGNGGLEWEKVKKVILNYVYPLSKDIEVIIYEPSLSYKATIKKAPKLTMSHLVLMNIKNKLNRFSKFRLQKAAFFINIFSQKDYFKFNAHHYGPYAHSIEILSRDIKEFQEYHKFQTDKALEYAHQTLISKRVNEQLEEFSSPIERATNLINSYSSNEKIELLSTICFVLLNNQNIDKNIIVKKVHEWSDLKKSKFSDKQITIELNKLLDTKLIQKNILNEYSIEA